MKNTSHCSLRYREMTTLWLPLIPCIFFSATSSYHPSFSPHKKLSGASGSSAGEVYSANFIKKTKGDARTKWIYDNQLPFVMGEKQEVQLRDPFLPILFISLMSLKTKSSLSRDIIALVIFSSSTGMGKTLALLPGTVRSHYLFSV